MSLGTSSQAGAVKDFIGDFLGSLKPIFYLVFIPTIILALYYTLIETRINKKELTKEELINYYITLTETYPIISIEDAFSEDDIDSIKKLTELIGNKIMLVGDDYFVTNIEYLQKGITEKYNNAILLKANQIGTITEMLETIKLAKNSGFKTIISHRSGETEDIFISQMAVGLNLGYIKTGSLCRGERIAKYNELLRIEEKVGH